MSAVGLRSLASRRGYTSIVVLTLALGIGVTTSLLTVVDGVLLRPLPYPDSDELLRVHGSWAGGAQMALSSRELVDLEEWLTDFGAVGGYALGSQTLTGDGQAERVRVAWATSGVWEVLAVSPTLGRLYTEEEDRAGAPVALLTDRFWRSRFGADPLVVGRTVEMSGLAVEVVGVLPPEFRMPEDIATDEPTQLVRTFGLYPRDRGPPGAGQPLHPRSRPHRVRDERRRRAQACGRVRRAEGGDVSRGVPAGHALSHGGTPPPGRRGRAGPAHALHAPGGRGARPAPWWSTARWPACTGPARVRSDGGSDWEGTSPSQVVGVIDDVRHTSLDEDARPQMYFAQAQFRFWTNAQPVRSLNLVVQSSLPSSEIGPAIRARLAERDPNLALNGLTTLTEAKDRVLARPRFTAALLGSFSGFALLLALVGVYGVMMYAVRERTPEFGIRIALGAPPENVLGSVLGDASRIVSIGVAVGLAGTLALSTVLRRFLFGVSPTDPVSLTLTILGVVATALLASYLPARAAARADPVRALRGSD